MAKRIYLDYAATTPIRPEVLEAMLPFMAEQFGNPSSLHSYGQAALKAIDEARAKIQQLIGAESFRDIIFTASATEANNLILKGLSGNYLWRRHTQPHLISSSIDHPSVTEVLKELEYLGLIQTTLIDPEPNGVVAWPKFEAAIRPNTILISLHYVNSETGVIQPLSEFSQKLRRFNHSRPPGVQVLFHTDASQAALTEPINIKELGVDALTLSSHKIYGPKGAAVLYLRQDLELWRLVSGSEQEFGRRAGTENVPAIVGLAKALELAASERIATRSQLKSTRNYLLEKLRAVGVAFELNTDLEQSSPKLLNLYLPNVDIQELIFFLDQHGIAVSAGMACQARALLPSPVIQRQFQSIDRAKSSLRLSFGRETSLNEIGEFIARLSEFFKPKRSQVYN